MKNDIEKNAESPESSKETLQNDKNLQENEKTSNNLDNTIEEELQKEIDNVKNRIIEIKSQKEDMTREIKKHIQIKYDSIQNKTFKLLLFCTQFEKELKGLGQRITLQIRSSYERIDDIKDSIRMLSLHETELSYKIQKLKAKAQELEQQIANQSAFLNSVESGRLEIGEASLQGLYEQLKPLEEEYRQLEYQLAEEERHQEELLGTIHHKKRILKISKTEHESDIKKLTINFKFMDEMRKEMLSKIEATKNKVKDTAIAEMRQVNKLTEEWQDVAVKHKNLYKEKIAVEKENQYLKAKIQKLQEDVELKFMG